MCLGEVVGECPGVFVGETLRGGNGGGAGAGLGGAGPDGAKAFVGAETHVFVDAEVEGNAFGADSVSFLIDCGEVCGDTTGERLDDYN